MVKVDHIGVLQVVWVGSVIGKEVRGAEPELGVDMIEGVPAVL